MTDSSVVAKVLLIGDEVKYEICFYFFPLKFFFSAMFLVQRDLYKLISLLYLNEQVFRCFKLLFYDSGYLFFVLPI